MMTTKTIIGWIIGAVVVVGGGYYFVSNNTSSATNELSGIDNASSTSLVSSDVKTLDNNAKDLTLADYINSGNSYKCEVNQDYGVVKNVGSIYISSNKAIRGDFKMKVQSMDIKTDFIIKDNISYAWTSQTPGVGYKMNIQTEGIGVGESLSKGVESLVSMVILTTAFGDVTE